MSEQMVDDGTIGAIIRVEIEQLKARVEELERERDEALDCIHRAIRSLVAAGIMPEPPNDGTHFLTAGITLAESQLDAARARLALVEREHGMTMAERNVVLDTLRKERDLLLRWYFASRRDGWESSETESAVLDDVCCYFANLVSTEWPDGWTLDSTRAALQAAAQPDEEVK